jgi:hypothetical protein
MSQDPLTHGTWRTRLEERGHRLIEPEEDSVTGFTLRWDPDSIVTVAVEPDGTLRREYRERFFLCELEPEQVFRAVGCPERHQVRWLELVSEQPPGYWQDFLAGPGSWLLSRLSRFREVVVWSEKGLPWNGLDDPIHKNWGMVIPAGATHFFGETARPQSHFPHLISVHDRQFADALAACMLFASPGMRDCYLADAAATEVYLAHHHEKVVIFIPDAQARRKLLQKLEENSWLFTDVSGFASTLDEDDETGEDQGNPEDEERGEWKDSQT